MALVGESAVDKDIRSKEPKSHPRFIEGIYQLIRNRTSEHIAGSGNKIMYARTVRRKPDPWKWKIEKLESLRVRPFYKQRHEQERNKKEKACCSLRMDRRAISPRSRASRNQKPHSPDKR